MSDILPLFTTHYSLYDSILTLEEAGKTEIGNPTSVCDLAREHHLKQVILVEERIDGFIEAYKNLSKSFKPNKPKPLDDYIRDEQGGKKEASDLDKHNAKVSFDKATTKFERESKWSTEPIQLIYGLKLTVVPDMTIKDEASIRDECKVIIFLKNSQAYNDVLKIWSRAWTDGFYYQGRIDWKTLKSFWTPNLMLALPFFSSFIAKNLLTMASIVPDLPCPAAEIQVFKEVGSDLPFAPLIDKAVDEFATQSGAQVQRVKSIYYRGPDDFAAYQTFRAMDRGGSYSAPNVSHLASDRFSFADWQRLTT